MSDMGRIEGFNWTAARLSVEWRAARLLACRNTWRGEVLGYRGLAGLASLPGYQWKPLGSKRPSGCDADQCSMAAYIKGPSTQTKMT